MPDPGPLLRQSPLDAEHRALGARMTAFGGFEMPLAYSSGTIAEHLACRRAAAVFDVSHLGTVRLRGAGAFEVLQRSLSNDLSRIAPGRAQYTHLLAGDGSVLDDLIVWWVEPERFEVMPNASNTERVLAALGGDDVTEQRAVVAVQGPQARRLLSSLSPEAAAVERFAVARLEIEGVPVLVAGTGYTGEDGVEIAVPADAAPRLWRGIVASGAVPAGLGARDTLRLEAGLPLHSHELGPGITPLQAGLGWVVTFDKGEFTGREALLAERRLGPRRRLRALLAAGRRPPRAGDPCELAGGGTGEVTSGNFSPVLERGIALAFLPPATGIGEPVLVTGRGEAIETTVVKPPFHRLAGASSPSASSPSATSPSVTSP